MAKIDRNTIKQLCKIAPAFFLSEKRLLAIGLLLSIAAISLTIKGLDYLMSFIGRDFMTALAVRERDEFFRQLYRYLLAFAVITPVVVFYTYTEQRLSLAWRQWLSRHLLRRYFSRRAYYQINFFSGLDNPDQRIEEDIRTFTSTSLSLILITYNSTLTVFFFLPLLWSISANLAFAVVGYAVLGSALTYFLGRPLIGLNFAQLKKEADYRYKLVNIRDNAESIAFIGDEKKEFTRVRQRLKYALNNMLRIINWNRNLQFFTTGYNYIVTILPTIIVAPLYLEGKIEFGVVTQAAFAFTQVLGALSSILVNNFGQVSTLAAVTNRLGGFWDTLDQIEKDRLLGTGTKIILKNGSDLEFKDVTINTPKNEQTLIENLNLRVDSGGLLISGPSGSGKSSILRSIAGLWSSGSGEIIKPKPSETMFIPQRPYMVLGSLRNQLLYAVHRRGLSDELLLSALRDVGLEEMFERVGGFSSVLDWPTLLSSGEQQRLSFARLILMRPRFAILDEATTALDAASEEQLYSKIIKICPLFVSVGYRASLSKYHTRFLTLQTKGKYRIDDV